MLTATHTSSPAILRVSSTRAAVQNSTTDEVRSMGIEAVREALRERRSLTSAQRHEKQMVEAAKNAAINAARLAAR